MDASPFARLSPELRNAIYDLVIAEDKDERIEEPTYYNLVFPAITQVCRQMRDECLLIYFGEVPFKWDLHCRKGVDRKTFWQAFRYGFGTRKAPQRIFDTNIYDFCDWLDAVDKRCHSVIKLYLKLYIADEMFSQDGEYHAEMMEAWKHLALTLLEHGYMGDRVVFKISENIKEERHEHLERMMVEEFGEQMPAILYPDNDGMYYDEVARIWC